VLTLLQAQSYIDKWFNLYKGVSRWIQETQRMALQNGYVETLYGRRRYLPAVHSTLDMVRAGALRQSVNTPVQSGANDITLMALAKMCNYCTSNNLKSFPILVVHDEIIVEAWEPEIDIVKEKLESFMTKDVYKITVPLVAEASVLDKWEKD
jgi:DNA polymerase-1